MRVVRSLERARGLLRRSVVTIGNFDGVHAGHRFILRQLRRDADSRGTAAVVLTFDPHPVGVVRPEAAPALLMTLADRLGTLRGEDVDVTVVQRFGADFAAIEAEDFIRRFLVEILDADKILVGHDLNFGRGRLGSAETLVAAGSRYGFAVEVIGPVEVGGVVVHSSVIRRLVAEGDVAAAARLLGRPHRVRGRVQPGAGRGAALGFATANLRPRTPCVPGEGVYATFALLGGRRFQSATSIGTTPTFGGSARTVETHIFADVGTLYGKVLGVEFVEKLRDQRRFDHVDALREQVGLDIEAARRVLAAHSTE